MCGNSESDMSKKVNATQSLWYKGVEQGSYANRNALLGQKLCHYLCEGCTLNGLLSSSQTKISIKATESIWTLTATTVWYF